MRGSVFFSVACFVSIFVACTSDKGSSNSSAAPVDAGVLDGGEDPLNDSGPDPKGDSSTNPMSKVDVTVETLLVGGQSRSFALAVPKSYDKAKTYPLILALHGDGGDGPGFRAGYPLDDVTGSDAIVAYPTGNGSGWDLYTPAAQNGDFKFIEALVADLRGRFTSDPARVFALGYSSGGFMINQVACRRTGFFRGIVSYAGGAPDEPNDPSASQWPNGYTKCAGQTGGVAAMIVHGTADGAVTLDSGDFDAAYWGYVNGCASSRSATTPAPCVKHDNCPADQPVLFCAIPGLGHTPSADGPQTAWAFIQSL